MNFNQRRGFSLLEVAIALALFVIGALAVVRLFPGALGIIQGSGSETVASNFNRSYLARFESDANAVPDAIYDGSMISSTGTINNADTPMAVVGTAVRNASLSTDFTQGFAPNALERFLHVYNERHTIVGGAITTLFPYEDADLTIRKEEEIEGLKLNSDGTLNFSDASKSASDIAGSRLYVSYRYKDSADNVFGVDEEPLENLTARVSQAEVTGHTVIPGVVTARHLSFVTNSLTPSTAEANLGLVDLSAIGGLSNGDTVCVSYSVQNWYTLVSENLAPQQPETAGNPQLFELPVPADRGRGTAVPVLTWNSPTNSPTVGSGALVIPTGQSRNKDTTVAYTVTGYPRTRFVFRSLDEWATQLSVAARTYMPYVVNGTTNITGAADHPMEGWRTYSWSSTDAEFIYLPPFEAGKALQVTYIDLDSSNNKRTRTEIVPIDEDWTDSSTSPLRIGGKVARAELPTSALSILSVKGASVQVRSAWVEGTRYRHSILSGKRGGLS